MKSSSPSDEQAQRSVLHTQSTNDLGPPVVGATSTTGDPLSFVFDPRLKRRASLALRQVVVSGTEMALQNRTGGMVQDFLQRDAEATRLLSNALNRFLIDSSGSEEDTRSGQMLWKRTCRPRTHIFADRSFWRRARQIACFEFVYEQMRSSINTFWKESLRDSEHGRSRAQLQAREVLKIMAKRKGLKTAVAFQTELLAFHAVLRDKREGEAALTNKLHRDGKGIQDFWSIYHKEDSKWLALPGLAPASPSSPPKAEAKPQSPKASQSHAALSKRSQVVRKVLQHRCEIQQKRLPPLEKCKPSSIPEIQESYPDSRPMTRQEQGYFDLGRFLEPRKRRGGQLNASLSMPALPRGRSSQCPSMNSSSSSWRPRAHLELSAMRENLEPMTLTKASLSFESSMPVPLDRVAGPFLRPWQAEVRTETGLREPEAEEDSATMRYIRECQAIGVVPTAAVLEMVRKCAITSGGEFLLDDELTAMSTMIGHLSSIYEVILAGSTKLSDPVLHCFLQQLFGRPAMDSLEKLDLARCRGAGPKAASTLVGLLRESNGLYKLRHLDISGMRISTATMTALCQSLHVHPAIRCLYIADTGLGVHPNAAGCLQDLLLASSLEVLGIGWNSFSEEALKSLGDMLAGHKRLRELLMPNCDSCASTQSSTHSFLEGLYRNGSLTMLDLSMNRLDSFGALILEDSLARHSKLQELYVSQNPLGRHGLRCLLRLLSQSTCGLRLLDATGSSGPEKPTYQATEPSGTYRLDLSRPYGRCLLRLLYKTCNSLSLDFAQAFQNLSYTPTASGLQVFQHPGKDPHGAFSVPTSGIVSFQLSLDAATQRLVVEAEGLDAKARGPRPLAQLYLDRHFARLRPKLTFRKVVCLLAQFRSLKGRPDEQKLILDALSTDFTLEYEFLSVICEDAYNDIDALCSLLAGVHRNRVRLFLALTHLPRLREYIKVYRRCERLLIFNADCPTGHYQLDLSNPSDYAVAEMLKMLDAWESAMARLRVEDRSQHGNWSSVRNCVYHNVSILSLRDWILPYHETLELDFVTWRRPSADALPFDAARWEEIMAKLTKAPLLPRAKAHVLRNVAERLFLTSMQCRQLLGCFGEYESRIQVLCCVLMRLADPQNLKLVTSRLEAEESKQLRKQLGTLSLFPYIQPEQTRFVLDMSVYEDRIAASLAVKMHLKESVRGSIRKPRFVTFDKNELAFDRGVPQAWQKMQAIPQGGSFSFEYVCSPEDRCLDVRRDLFARYGGWNADVSKGIIWWASLQDVPQTVSSFLVHVMRHFKNNARAAFQLIDGPEGTGKLTLFKFKAAVTSLGWKEFVDSEKAVEIFRYLDPDGGGSISKEEWKVMIQLLQELQLSILELLQHVHYTFGSVEVAYALLDKDGSCTVDSEEWSKATHSMGYFGPSSIIYKYLCIDDTSKTLTKERWKEVLEMWSNREAIYQKFLRG